MTQPSQFVFNQTPGDGNPDTGGGSAHSINAKILVELRIQSLLLLQFINQAQPGLMVDIDLDDIRADPSSLNQRLG